jgi:hypothetical protein
MEWQEDAVRSFLIGLHEETGMRNAGAVKLSGRWTTIGKEGLNQNGMKAGKIFFNEGCSLELAGHLEAWFLEYLSSDVDAG